MPSATIVYRLHQFILALWGQPDPEGLAEVEAQLGAAGYALFQRLQPSEQAHALAVYRQMRQQGHDDPASSATIQLDA